MDDSKALRVALGFPHVVDDFQCEGKESPSYQNVVSKTSLGEEVG